MNLLQLIESVKHVQSSGAGIKWCSRDCCVNNVGCSDGVRSEQSDNLVGREASIGEASNDSGNAVSRLWDSQIWGGSDRGRASEHELKTGSTRAVCCADSSGKMDAMSFQIEPNPVK